MRLPAILLAVFILPATLAPAWAQGQPFPYDPYPWCAVYSGRGGGGTNCGFRTWPSAALADFANVTNSTIRAADPTGPASNNRASPH
jgi:hypothetical protein